MKRAEVNRNGNQTIECDLCGKGQNEHITGKTIKVCYKDESEPYGTPIRLCDECYKCAKASGIYKIKILQKWGC